MCALSSDPLPEKEKLYKGHYWDRRNPETEIWMADKSTLAINLNSVTALRL